jgi:hypothetical protein
MRECVLAVVGDDFAVIVDDGEICEEIGEKLNARAALIDCERRLIVNVRLLHARLGMRAERKLGLPCNLVEVDSSMSYTVRKFCTKVERSDDGLRICEGEH